MALTEEQINALAQAGMASRTASGATVVQAPRGTRAPATKPYEPRPGIVSEFINKAKNVAIQTPRVIGTIGKAIGNYAVQEVREIPGEIYRTATVVAPTLLGGGLNDDIRFQQKAMDSLQKTQDNVTAQYKAGRMTKEDYNKALSEISKGFSSIGQEAGRTVAKADPGKAVEDFVDTAALLFTMGSGKLASAASSRATESLVNKETVSVLTKVNLGVENAVKKLPCWYFSKLLYQTSGSATKLA